MLILSSFRYVFIIYILAAVLPAVFLLRYVYRMDKTEKEPASLLIKLLLVGVLAALASIVLEMLASYLLPLFFEKNTLKYQIVYAFCGVAVIEEGMKFIFLKYTTWRNKNFDYTFDAIVYSVFVSLGFAAFENIKYVLSYGLSVALPRAVLAVPGHMGFAVFMGIYYGRAKVYEKQGRTFRKRASLFKGYLLSVLLHGFYDACVMVGSTLSMVIFIVFVIIMYIVVLARIKAESAGDRRI